MSYACRARAGGGEQLSWAVGARANSPLVIRHQAEGDSDVQAAAGGPGGPWPAAIGVLGAPTGSPCA